MENSFLQEKQKEFIENFSDAVVIQYNGKIIWVNSAVSHLIGKNQAELEGTNFLDLFPADQKEIVKKKYINDIKKIRSISVHEFYLQAADKVLLPIEMIAILSEFGDSPAVICMIRDISNRKRMEEALKQSENLYRTLVETLQDGLSIMDLQGKILYCNQKKAEMFGYKNPEELKGKSGFDLIVSEEREQAALLMQQIFGQGFLKNQEFTVVRKDGSCFPAEFSASLLRDGNGIPVQIVDIMRDITDRRQVEEKMKASLKEKEVLLQEIHHRVKNNMQIISSLLNLQSSTLKDKKVVDLFTESRNRIRSMALIHEKLYQSQNLAHINFGEYIQTLTTHLFHTYKVDPSSVVLKTELQDVFLDINTAIPCSLIINELVSNSLKHAFPNQKQGEIRIKFKQDKNVGIILSISDNGIGFKPGYDPQKPKTLGLQIVHDLVHQINGELHFQGKNGTLFLIEF